MGRMLMTVGLVLFAAGLLLHFGGRLLPNGWRLPGDILVQRGNLTFYFPLMTSLLLSLLLTGVLWFFRR